MKVMSKNSLFTLVLDNNRIQMDDISKALAFFWFPLR